MKEEPNDKDEADDDALAFSLDVLAQVATDRLEKEPGSSRESQYISALPKKVCY